jgi:hypothetical protein
VHQRRIEPPGHAHRGPLGERPMVNAVFEDRHRPDVNPDAITGRFLTRGRFRNRTWLTTVSQTLVVVHWPSIKPSPGSLRPFSGTREEWNDDYLRVGALC